jgi:hypothetical protein
MIKRLGRMDPRLSRHGASVIGNARLNGLIERARMYGWKLRKLNTPLRHGKMLVRYVLADEHGETYFSRIDVIEQKMRRADQGGE